MDSAVQAFKAAMQSFEPKAQVADMRPEMPGRQSGTGGARGATIAGVAQNDSRSRWSDAHDRSDATFLAWSAVKSFYDGIPPGPEKDSVGRLLSQMEKQRDAASESVLDAFLRMKSEETLTGTGESIARRIQEEKARQASKNHAQALKESQKLATVPNYSEWQAGSIASSSAREVRGGAHDVKGAAGALRGKVDAGVVADVRAKADHAKDLAKAADVAGKKARDAARFGTAAEAEAAANAAREAREKAEGALEDARDALAQAQREDSEDDDDLAGDTDGGTDPHGGDPPGPNTPVSHPLGVFPNCGDPLKTCPPCNPVCKPGRVCVCHHEPGSVIGGDGGPLGDIAPGVKGSGMAGAETPGDATSQSDGDARTVAPADSSTRTGEGQTDTATAEGNPKDAPVIDIEGTEYSPVEEGEMMFFPTTGAVAIKQDGEWYLIPPGLARACVLPTEDGPIFAMDIFMNGVARAAQELVLGEEGDTDFDGSFDEFLDKYGSQYEAAREGILDGYRIEESDLKFAIPLKQAWEATYPMMEGLREVARWFPPTEFLSELVDLAEAAARGDLDDAGVAALSMALPFGSDKFLKLLRQSPGVTEIIVEAGKKVEVDRYAGFRKTMDEATRKGDVALPDGFTIEDIAKGAGKLEVHHPLARKLKKELAAMGVDVDRYLAWVSKEKHRGVIARGQSNANANVEAIIERVDRGEISREVGASLLAKEIERQQRDYAITVYLIMERTS